MPRAPTTRCTQSGGHNPIALAPSQRSRAISNTDEDKLFRCNKCAYMSPQRSNFDTHQRKHSGEKPFKCPDCDLCVADKSSLIRHRKKLHQYIPQARNPRRSNVSTVPPSPPHGTQTSEIEHSSSVLFGPTSFPHAPPAAMPYPEGTVMTPKDAQTSLPSRRLHAAASLSQFQELDDWGNKPELLSDAFGQSPSRPVVNLPVDDTYPLCQPHLNFTPTTSSSMFLPGLDMPFFNPEPRQWHMYTPSTWPLPVCMPTTMDTSHSSFPTDLTWNPNFPFQ